MGTRFAKNQKTRVEMLRKLWDNLKNGTEATGFGKGTKEIRMLRHLLFVIMIFPLTFTGCGEDGGGGGNGHKLVNYIGELSRVGAGSEYSCALTSVGGVKCWGEGANGRLGNNATADTDAPDDVDTDSSDTLLTGIVQVSAGWYHACALTSGGNVKCWGAGGNGELGNDCDDGCADSNISVDVKSADDSATNLSGIVQVSAGGYHTCALTSMGSVKCWGQGREGRLGNNDTADKDAPVDVVTSSSDTNPLTGIVQISAEVAHTCALTSKGNVKCWGSGGFGQLGNGAWVDKSYPVDVVASAGSNSLLGDIVQVSVGSNHACALTSGGNVKCWGAGDAGQMGNGTTALGNNAPVSVTTSGSTALSGILGISTSMGYHSCAIKPTGTVVCWGVGRSGQLGNNATSNQSHPVNVLTSADGNPALSGIAQIGLGFSHSCAVTDTGKVLCWGKGDDGELGNDCNGSCADSNFPVTVVDENGGSGTLNIGTTAKRYICGDVRCALETE